MQEPSETPRRAKYEFKVNGKLMKKKESMGLEANSIQLTKRTNGPCQRDASVGSFLKAFENLPNP